MTLQKNTEERIMMGEKKRERKQITQSRLKY